MRRETVRGWVGRATGAGGARTVLAAEIAQADNGELIDLALAAASDAVSMDLGVVLQGQNGPLGTLVWEAAPELMRRLWRVQSESDEESAAQLQQDRALARETTEALEVAREALIEMDLAKSEARGERALDGLLARARDLVAETASLRERASGITEIDWLGVGSPIAGGQSTGRRRPSAGALGALDTPSLARSAVAMLRAVNWLAAGGDLSGWRGARFYTELLPEIMWRVMHLEQGGAYPTHRREIHRARAREVAAFCSQVRALKGRPAWGLAWRGPLSEGADAELIVAERALKTTLGELDDARGPERAPVRYLFGEGRRTMQDAGEK